MNNKIPALAAVLACCLSSCVEVNNQIGGNFIADNLKYTLVSNQTVMLDVENVQADSLSGFSSNWATIGAIHDKDLGLTTRATALYLVPIHDSLDFGVNPVINRMHLAMALDSVSVADEAQRHILQNVNVYSLKKAIDPKYTYDCNMDFRDMVDMTHVITKTSPVINGKDSLSFDFTKEYASQFLNITQEDLKDIKKYREKIKGFYINTDIPSDNSGRINMFKVQLGFDAQYFYLSGNYASLKVTSTFDGVRKDTSYFFYLSPSSIYDIDSLLLNTSVGNLPQYAFNLTQQQEDKPRRTSSQELCVEGGGGLKPRILAKGLKKQVRDMIEAKGYNPDKVVLTKASLTFNYEAPDAKYEGLARFPYILSPTVRLHVKDTTDGVTVKKVVYQGITDSSSESENQGNVNYSLQNYAPDITYHLQEIISTPDSLIDRGDYDIWLLIMAYRTTVVTNSEANEMSDLYSAMAYQQYYNNMYGGYGGYGGYGYGGYGYGGYGYDPYSNYYSYMMMSQMYSQSATSSQVTVELDRDRYYKAYLCGPGHHDENLRPRLVFSYAIPNSY